MQTKSPQRQHGYLMFGLLCCFGFALMNPTSCVAAASLAGAPTSTYWPQGQETILERLPPRTKVQVPAPASSAGHSQSIENATRLVEQARMTGDPRYLGRAQSAIAQLWNSERAPSEAIILQATIEQSRHEFTAAKRSLIRAIKLANQRFSNAAQAWLTLASIERVEGNYSASRNACEKVIEAQEIFYGMACRFETMAHVGQHDSAIAGLNDLLNQVRTSSASDRQKRAWLLSLIAESYERAGQALRAFSIYQKSINISPDLYTTLVASDLVLRADQNQSQNAQEALDLLKNAGDSDAVLLRRALAQKQLMRPQWSANVAELESRFAEADIRGDDPIAHARERAMLALWLTDKPASALQWALKNLDRQKETVDWWIAIQAAKKANDLATLKSLSERLQQSKLIDARLRFNEKVAAQKASNV